MELTPKEKANDLIEKFYHACNLYTKCVYCALIAVDLRLEGNFSFTSIKYGEDSLEYWQQVKEELLKIK